MADADFVASLADTVSALGLEKIPDRLHCNACHKFNLNAYKTTCCDTVICESCFTSRCDISCPICDHKPFNSDVCKPNKAMRATVKSYLKTIEKARAEAKTAELVVADNDVQPEQTNTATNGHGEVNGSVTMVTEAVPASTEERETTPAIDVQPSIEDHDPDSYEPDDDHVEIQVEPDEDQDDIPSRNKIIIEDPAEDQYDTEVEKNNNKATFSNSQDQAATNGMDANDFSNMMNGFNNMDYNQMMQMMAANGMGNFNPMMGMPMGMNSMSPGMFGGFGGPNGGMNNMNGMDMGMNFNPNQGMYSGWNNGQNNNMWQNNNANAFSNGMGGDFGSNYGFNMAQSGNFQQQYPNGDFQNGYYGRGYGRGRGRGRGGYGRGRGNFNQYPQFQQQQAYSSGPNQHDNEAMRSQNTDDHKNDTSANEPLNTNIDHYDHEHDEFAPGGQDEIQEALGEDYQKPTATDNDKKASDTLPTKGYETHQEIGSQNKTNAEEAPDTNGTSKEIGDAPIPIPSVATDDPTPSDQPKPIPAAYEEDLQGPMPPPSAPLGPAAQYDYGYRARGHGRFAQRGRGSISMQNGHSAPQVKPNSQIPQAAPGVVGAPTGPRAMREPPAPSRPASRPASASSGFHFIGRASMGSPKRPESHGLETSIGKTPTSSEHDDYKEKKDDSRRYSRQENYSSSKYDVDEQDSDERDKEKDRRYRRSSKRSTYDDYDRDERQPSIEASDSADRKSSRRSRADKETTSISSKNQISRSRTYHDEDANGDHEMEDYEESGRSHREGRDGGESRSRHRSGRSSKYDDRDRERDRDREKEKPRDRDRDRDRDRERERDKDRDREDRYREKERDRDRDRKRSRHDRHREDDKDYDKDYDYEHHDDDQESRHRSRRHKRDHHRQQENDEYSTTAVATTSRSHRSSATGTPTPIASAAVVAMDKDPHTLEREARNRERMLKEQQRREKAAAKSGSGGGGGAGEHHSSRGSRRVNYKYEDDIERSLAESERSSARWR